MDQLLLLVAVAVGAVAGLAVGALLGTGALRRDGHRVADQVGASLRATESVVAPVKDSLDRFDGRLRDLESSGVAWQERLAAQVEAVRLTGEGLRRESAALSTALRRPQVRGQWGEMHLRRAVELAGMVERCDFTTQESLHADDGVQRPDVVVRLAGGRRVVVDAKVPLDAFLRAGDAIAQDDEQASAAHLAQHARQVRAHVDALAAKAYWRRLDPSPEFVVMFVPGEAFLSYALDADPSLLEHAAARRVVPATPTTLIALLRTVAYAWTQESLAESARDVQRVAHELYERLGSLGGHLDKLGRSLTTSVDSYNRAVGALESRVLVSARRLHSLGVGGEPPVAPRSVAEGVRPLGAAELVGDALARLDEVPSGADDEDLAHRHDVSPGATAGDDPPARRAV